MRRALLVVAKRPAPGRTKTRLCPPLSAEAAAGLYECFLRDTLDLMRQVPGVDLGVAYLTEDGLSDGEVRSYFCGLATDMTLFPQRGQHLGERLDHLLRDALDAGADCAVVMDSDSPTLPPAYVAQAFNLLDGSPDVALGPCDDGGYYLIGVKRPLPRLLREVHMSTPHVARDTLALAKEMNLSVGLLPAWYDVDTAAELQRLRAELDGAPPQVAPHTRAFLSALYADLADHPSPG